MKAINLESTKNKKQMFDRGISFEDIVFYLQQGALLDDVEHPIHLL